MKYIDIYSFIVQENVKIADPNILNAVPNGMKLIVNNKLLTFMKQRWHTCRSSKVVLKKKTKNGWKMN